MDLIEATRSSDATEVGRLLAGGAAVDAADAGGRTALWWASSRGHTDVVRSLLAAGASPLSPTGGSLPPHMAAAAGELPVVRLLLEVAPAAALAPTDAGFLPLHCAVLFNNCACVQQLLQAAPATAVAADNNGNTALHFATESCAAAAQHLVAAAPQAATVHNAAGRTPLQVVLQRVEHPVPGRSPADYVATARAILPAVPRDDALAQLPAGGPLVQPLYADLTTAGPLTQQQWQRVPAPCAGLIAALPAVLAR